MSLVGGNIGLLCNQSSSVIASDLNVSQAFIGISAGNGSSCYIIDSVVELNSNGLTSTAAGMEFIGGSVTDNTFGAVIGPAGAIAFRSDDINTGYTTSTPVISNGVFGIYIVNGTASLLDVVIENNQTGVQINAGGFLNIGAPNISVIIQNNNTGIFVSNLSSMFFVPGPQLQILNNSVVGIACQVTTNASFNLIDNSNINFSGNGTNITDCP